MKEYILLGLLLLLPGSYIAGQTAVSVTARADATSIIIGDQVRYFLEVKHDSELEYDIQWVSVPDTFNSLEVVERGLVDTIADGRDIIYRQRLLITGFDSGAFIIPAFAFTIIPAAADPIQQYTDSFVLHVQTVAVDTSKPFRGIREILEVKTTWRDYAGLIGGGFGLVLILAAFIFWLLRRRKTKPTAAPAIPEVPLYERTIQALVALEQQQLWQQDKIKEYYTTLTDILRDYIEERFRTPAMELTSDQLLESVHRHPEMCQYYDELATILTTADLAKFAKAKPLPHEHTSAMDHVRAFVTDTRQVIIETPQNTKGS